GIVAIEKTENALQKVKELRRRMLGLGADLDQLNKIRGCLRPQITLANSNKRVAQDHLSQSVQIRPPASRNLYLRGKEKIELARERTLRPARSFGHGLNQTQRVGAPGNNQARVTQFPSAQKDRFGGFSHRRRVND